MTDNTERLKVEVAERLKVARASFTLNQKEFASISGVGFSTYQKYEMGLSLPGSEAMLGFANIKINANWLLTGKGEMMLDAEDAPLSMPYAWQSENAEHSVRERQQSAYASTQQAPLGLVLVPRYDVAASMGNGAVIHSEQVVDHLAFREEWVRTELGANPKNLLLISAIGDSMEPDLRAGDLLLVDRSYTTVNHDAVYAFSTNGELRVKRMQLKIDGTLVVRSANAQYEPEYLTPDQAEHLHIVGRVVWSGRRM